MKNDSRNTNNVIMYNVPLSI